MSSDESKIEIFIGDPDEVVDWGDKDIGKVSLPDFSQRYLRIPDREFSLDRLWTVKDRDLLDAFQRRHELKYLAKAASPQLIQGSQLKPTKLVSVQHALRLSGSLIAGTTAFVAAIEVASDTVLVQWFILASIATIGVTLTLMSFTRE